MTKQRLAPRRNAVMHFYVDRRLHAGPTHKAAVSECLAEPGQSIGNNVQPMKKNIDHRRQANHQPAIDRVLAGRSVVNVTAMLRTYGLAQLAHEFRHHHAVLGSAIAQGRHLGNKSRAVFRDSPCVNVGFRRLGYRQGGFEPQQGSEFTIPGEKSLDFIIAEKRGQDWVVEQETLKGLPQISKKIVSCSPCKWISKT